MFAANPWRTVPFVTHRRGSFHHAGRTERHSRRVAGDPAQRLLRRCELSVPPCDTAVPIALAIGGNLGDRAATLRDAVRQLVAGGVQVDAVSSLYETPPWGYTDQPPFLNGAVRGRTTLAPHDLLALVKQIEHDLGRQQTFRNGPRPVDIDIALYGGCVINELGLHVPHLGLPERAFVLVPLAEIAGTWVHPPTGKSIADLRAALGPADEIKHFLAPARWAYFTPEMKQGRTFIVDAPTPSITINMSPDSSTHPRYSARVLALHQSREYWTETRRLGMRNRGGDALFAHLGFVTVQIDGVAQETAKRVEGWENEESHVAISPSEQTTLLVTGTPLGISCLTRAFDCGSDQDMKAVGTAINLAVKRHRAAPATVTVGKHRFDWANRVVVMGILNATPDSFSDAGKYFRFDDALRRAHEMAAQGATMIEVGGQSAQPGTVISVDEELARIVPLLERLRDEIDLPLAVDTFRVGVARGAVEAGAVYINDIGGGGDEGDGMARLAAEAGALLGIMHLRGRPKEMQWETDYESVMDEVTGFLHERIGRAVNVGVAREKIVIDPGLGFGKEAPHDLEVMHRFAELRSFGLPILLATSRKNYLSDTVGGTVHDLLPETAAAVTHGIAQGASIIRVHDVAFMARIARLMPHILRHAAG
ncbi:MAG: dihydropteroate synthase [Thermomicrobiales bacterium]